MPARREKLANRSAGVVTVVATSAPAADPLRVAAALVVKQGLWLGTLIDLERMALLALGWRVLPSAECRQSDVNDALRAALAATGALRCLRIDDVELRRWLVDAAGDGDDLVGVGPSNSIVRLGAGHDEFAWGYNVVPSGPATRTVVSASTGDDLLALSFGPDAGDVHYAFHNGTVTFANATLELSGFDRLRIFGGGGNDDFTGSVHDDWLAGGDGDDRLVGGGGNDLIDGGFGTDRVRGDAGADRFVLNNPGEGYDVVEDFQRGQDHLVVGSLFGFAVGETVRVVNSTNPDAPGNAPVFVFETDTHRLWFDRDGAGAGGQWLLAELHGVSALSSSDFVLG